MIVLVDMDGVIVEFHEKLTNELRHVIETKNKIDNGETVNSEGYQDLLALVPNGTFDIKPHKQTKTMSIYDDYSITLKPLVKAIYNGPGFCKDLNPVPGVVKAFEEMTAAGHDVLICTAPYSESPTCLQDKRDWIANNLGDEWVKRTLILMDKTMIKADMLIDDKPVVSGRFDPPYFTEHVVFDRPFNQHITDKRRLKSWAEWQSLF